MAEVFHYQELLSRAEFDFGQQQARVIQLAAELGTSFEDVLSGGLTDEEANDYNRSLHRLTKLMEWEVVDHVRYRH